MIYDSGETSKIGTFPKFNPINFYLKVFRLPEVSFVFRIKQDRCQFCLAKAPPGGLKEHLAVFVYLFIYDARRLNPIKPARFVKRHPNAGKQG